MTQPQMSTEQAIALAHEHQQAGRLQDAEALARQVLAEEPNQPNALHLMASIAYQVGRADVAIELLRRLIVSQPPRMELFNDLGNSFMLARRLDEAIAAFRQALTLAPGAAAIYYNLGNALRERGQMDQAIAAFQQALIHRPEHPNSLNNLGNLLLERGRTDEAIAAYGQAVSLAPQMAPAHYNLARALRAAGNREQAIATLRHVVHIAPEYIEAYNNLGVLLEEQTRLEESSAVLGKARSLKPDSAEVHYNLGNAQRALGEFGEAVQSYERALAIKSDYVMAHYNLGLTHLLMGNWIKGWPGYERRWIANNVAQPGFVSPRWEGQSLHGKRILIHTEQGFGDSINFVRFVPGLAQAGARVVLGCSKEMERLFRCLPGVEMLISNERQLPRDVDFHSPLSSIPGMMGTTPQNIPASVPYLKADPQLSGQWRARLPQDGKRKIGIVWSGRRDDRLHKKRSISRRMFQPLAQIPNVTLVSLQKEASLDENDASSPFDMLDWTSELNDFADTAALIDNLDLVISIDSAVAHLAGAMGKPVWVPLLFVPDWRWLLEREDSVWYPTMRFFRQTKIGDWETPMSRVIQALRAL